MIDSSEISESIFSALKGFGFKIKMYTEEGAETLNPADAVSFFSLVPNMMVSVDEELNLVRMHKTENTTLEETEELLDRLKAIAHDSFYDFEIKNYGTDIQPKNYAFKAKNKREENLMSDYVTESIASRLTGTRKTSSQHIGEVRVVVKHNKEVDEEKRGARTRNIQSIFIETSEGRFKMPCKSLLGARALARHVANGGQYDDSVSEYILETTKQYMKLRDFVSYARSNKLINEESADVINTVRSSIRHIAERLKRFSGKNTYFSEKDKCDSRDLETTNEVDSDLKDMFTIKIFNDKLNDVLPVVSEIVASRNSYLEKVEEASNSTVYISEKPVTTGIVFEDSVSELGYKVESLAHNIVGNSDLQNFMLEMSKKINKQANLNSFETSVLENVLSNIKVFDATEVSEQRPVRESFEFAKRMNKLFKK